MVRSIYVSQNRQARATCANRFLKDLLTALLGSATWVCDMGASSEGLKPELKEKGAQGISWDLGEDLKIMETHPSRSDAGLVHLIPEPGELGSTASGDATNLQDSSSDAPCRKSQLCPNCSPLGAGSEDLITPSPAAPSFYYN